MRSQLGKLLSILLFACATPTCADEPLHDSGKIRFVVPIKVIRKNGPECLLTVEQVVEKSRRECPRQPDLFTSEIVQVKEPNDPFSLPSMPKFLRPGEKKPPLDLLNPPKWERRARVHLPDLLLLLEQSANCEDYTPFNRSFEQFTKISETPALDSPDMDPYVREIKKTLVNYRQGMKNLESAPETFNRFRTELVLSRYRILAEAGICSNLLTNYVPEIGLTPQVEAFNKKIEGKEVSSIADLYKLADAKEKQLLDLLFGGNDGARTPSMLNLLDFSLGPDKANHIRNVLLHGNIRFEKDRGFSLESKGGNSLFDSPLLNNDSVKRVKEVLSKVAEKDPTMAYNAIASLEYDLRSKPASDRADARKYLKGLIHRLETVGVQPTNLTDDALLRADRVRTITHRLLANLDSQVPAGRSQYAETFEKMIPEDKRAILTEGDNLSLSSDLLRRALRSPLVTGPTPFGDPLDLMDIEKIKFVRNASDKEKVDAMSSVDLTPEDFSRLQKNLQATRELYIQNLDHNGNLHTPYIYGREIAAENKKFDPEAKWTSTVDRIAQRLGDFEIGMTAKERMRLDKALDPFTLDLLDRLTQAANGEAPDPEAGFRKRVRPQIQELAKLIFEPEGKADIIQAMAVLSQLSSDSRENIYNEVRQNLRRVDLKLPKGYDLSNIYKASAAERDAVATQAETLLRDSKDLTESQKRALLVLSHLLREEGHDPEVLYAGRPLPALINELSLREQTTKHAIRKRQRDDIEASGTEGKKTVTSLENVENFLKKNNMGLPLNAEMGLLQFLERNGKTGDEALRRLMASVTPKIFAQAIAQMQPVNSDAIIQEALRDYLPHSLFLISNGGVQQSRAYAQAVQELVKDGKLSDDTMKNNAGMLVHYFQICANLLKSEDLTSAQNCMVENMSQAAARYALERGDREKADKLLSTAIPDATARAEKLDEFVHMNAASRKIRDRIQEKGLPWEEVTSLLKFDDASSVPELRRIEQITSWHRDRRALERKLAAEETQRDTERRLSLEGFQKAESDFQQVRAQARKAYENFTDAEFKEVTELWSQLEKQKEIAKKAKHPGGRQASPELRKLWELEGKVDTARRKAKGTFDIDDREKYLKLKAEYEVAENNELKRTNPNRFKAKQLVELAEAKRAQQLDAEGNINDPQTQVLSVISQLAGKSDPLAAELEELAQNFGLSGELSAGKKIYGPAELSDLLTRMKKATNSMPPSGPLAARAKAIIDECKAKPEDCPLSAARLTALTKDYNDQSLHNGMLDLNRPGSAVEAAESAEAQQKHQEELSVLQTYLTERARRFERKQNRDHQDVFINKMAGQLFPELKGAKKSTMIEALSDMRDNLLWGQSIADSVAQSTPNNPPPVNGSQAEMKEWMKRNGYQSIFEDWKFHMTSGLNKHSVPEAEAEKLFQHMLGKSWERESASMKRKKEIEDRLSQIIKPTHTRGNKLLWDWDKANLHLVAPTTAADRKDHHLISYEEFTDLLNEYAEKNGVSMHGLNPAFRRNLRGEEELHDAVHGTLARSMYRWDTANINANTYITVNDSKAIPDKNGISSVGVGYDFKNFAEARPKIEKQAADMQWLLANNGELNRAIDKQGGYGEGAHRIWRSLTWRDPETENDSQIERMTNEAASTILNISLMGDSRITYNGEERAAGAVGHALRQDLLKLLGKQSSLLKNVDVGYELTEQGIWLAAGIVAGYGIAGVAVMGTELLAAKNGVQLVLAGQRYTKAKEAITLGMRMESALNGMANLNSASRLGRTAQAINAVRKAGLTSKIVGYANQSKQMFMAGLEGKLYEKGFDIVMSRTSMYFDQQTADGWDLDGNGTPDWRDALNSRKPYHFNDVEALTKQLVKKGMGPDEAKKKAVELAEMGRSIDSDDNGIPDQTDIYEFGAEPEKYTTGSMTKTLQEVKSNSVTMLASPWAAGLAGRTMLRPFGRLVQKVGNGRLDWAPKYIDSFKSFAGMTGVSMLRSMVDADPDKSMLEELEHNWDRERIAKKLRESGYNSTFTAPGDDIAALWYLSYNPKATARQIWAIKSTFNHAQDFAQGFLSAALEGKYTAGNGKEIKNPFLAGAYNVGSSWKLSEKASDPKMAALDLLPDLVRADIVAKAGSGNSSKYEGLLDVELDTNRGKQKIRDLIKDKSNLEDLAAPEKHEAFFKMFSEILVRDGVDPASISDAYRSALARAGKNEVRFGEVATFINNVAYEVKIQDLLAGKISANDLIYTRDAGSKPNSPVQPRLLRLHHMLTVGEVAKADGTDFVNKEVKKAVWDVANDFRLNPIKFHQFVLKTKADPAKANEAMTLRMLAMEMMEAERVRNHSVTTSRP